MTRQLLPCQTSAELRAAEVPEASAGAPSTTWRGLPLRCRPGVSAVELLAGLSVGALFLTLTAAVIATELRRARTIAEAAARQDAVRVAWGVLASEIRYLTPADVYARGPDSLGVRALRAVLLPCAPGVFRYRGMRLPDASKDSIFGLVTGTVRPFRARHTVAPGSCDAPPGETLLAAEADESVEPLLLFESGAYHMQARALRYRLGSEGRQPLTGEWFDDAGSAFVSGNAPPPGAPVAVLRLAPRRTGPARHAAGTVRLSFFSANAGVGAGTPVP